MSLGDALLGSWAFPRASGPRALDILFQPCAQLLTCQPY